MADKRKHRGPHPDDQKLFGSEEILTLRKAVCDLSQLLSKGYAMKSSLKLVGDHFALTQRQRLAVRRSVCSDQQLSLRTQKQLTIEQITAQRIVIDGYNLLITLEALLSGAPVFIGVDGCLRDMSGIHGSYRRVTETSEALELLADYLASLKVVSVRWLFDRPVSNSGRLKAFIRELAEENGWVWEIELQFNPDKELSSTDLIIVTSDSDVLDNCGRWVNLTAGLIRYAEVSGRKFSNVIGLSGV